MPRVVIDTNVIISSLIYADKPAEILDMAIEKEITNIVSPHIVGEIQEVLAEKFLWQEKEVKKAVEKLKSFSEMVIPKKQINAVPYTPDNRILECAVEGGAEFIISGDHHLTDLKTFQGIKIVDPSTFLKTV